MENNYKLSPTRGFTRWLLFTCVLLVSMSATVVQAQVDVTATAGTTGPVTYATLKLAFDAINAGTHQGVITVAITANTTEGTTPATLNSSGAGSALYTSVSIAPSNDGVSISGNPVTGFGVIQLKGADNVTIDGDNPNTAGVNRNLTVVNTAAATVAANSAIRIATAATVTSADNNTIKNCVLNGNVTGGNSSLITSTTGSSNSSFGIFVGGNGGSSATDAPTAVTSVTGTTAPSGTTVNNLLIDNNSINQCARGIVFIGAAASVSTGVSITNNLVGDQATALSGTPPYTSPSTTVYTKAIYIAGTTAVNITGNIIKNILSYVATQTSGIELNTLIGTGGVTISNNSITGIVCNSTSTAFGIIVSSSASNYLISGNTISNIQMAGVGSASIAGIQATHTGTAATIRDNKISMVYNRTTNGWGSFGINIAGGPATTIQNNFISDINAFLANSGLTSQFGVFGLRIAGSLNHKVYHNTIHLSGAFLGSSSFTSISSMVITGTGQTGIDVRNNIFSNTMTGAPASSSVTCIFLPSGATSTYALTENNNAYYQGSGVGAAIAQVGTTTGSGIYLASNFNAAAITPSSNLTSYTSTLNGTGNNDNASYASSSAAPLISSTDLHLDLASVEINSVEQKGDASVGVLTDIDGNVRPNGVTTLPDMGADEVAQPSCLAANGGTIAPGTATVCSGLTYAMSSTGFSTGLGTTYQWEVSSTSGSGFVSVSGGSGANTPSYTTGALTAGVYYYRLTTTCSGCGPCSASSNELTLTVNQTPTSSITPGGPIAFCSSTPTALTAVTNGTSPLFQWTLNGNNIGLATGISHTPAVSGNYRVVVTNVGCVSTSSPVAVTVTASPTAVTVTPSSAAISCGGSQALVASGGLVPGILSNSITVNLSNPATDEDNGASGTGGFICPGNNIIGSFTMPPVPGGFVGAHITITGVTNLGGSYANEVGLHFSGPGVYAVSDCYDGNTGTNTPTVFNYTTGGGLFPGDSADIAALLNPAGGVVNITYSDGYNDVTSGPDASFPATATFQYFYNALVPGAFSWTPAGSLDIATGANVNASPIATTTYTASVTNGGCTTIGTSTVTVNPVASSVSISGNPSVVCVGNNVVITAVPTNGGGAPLYEFFVNNVSQGAASATNTLTYVPTNGDLVHVVMTSSDPCATPTATSNTLTMSVVGSSPASVSIPTVLNYCTIPGTVTVTATPTGGGATPLYEFFVNNVSQGAASASASFTYTPVNGDLVSVIMTSSFPCATGSPATSNAGTVTLNANPTASITADCTTLLSGNSSTLTATPASGVAYQWILNGTTNVGGGLVTYSAPTAGSYTVRVTTPEGCTATSNAIVLENTSALNGTYTIGGPAGCTNWTSFLNAGTDITLRGLSGNVTVNVAAGYSEIAPVGGMVLSQCALAANLKTSATRTLTFQKSGAGANPVINSQVGTSTTVDGIVKLVGMDYVTIDGIDLKESVGNITATTQMEWGYAFLKCTGNDGSNFNTVKNCSVTLNKANTVSTAIYSGNHIATSTAALTYTGTANDPAEANASRNGNNTFYGNAIQNTYKAFSLNGNANATGNQSLNDTLNAIGVIGQAANVITNFGGTSTACIVIGSANQRGITIDNNTINGGVGTTSTLTAINPGAGVWGKIRNNTITLVTSATTSAITGITISFSGGSLVNPNIVTVTGNNIVMSSSTVTTATITGITSAPGGTGAQIIVSNNSVSGCTFNTATTAAFNGIVMSHSSASTVNDVSNNTVNSNSISGSGQWLGINAFNATPTLSTLTMNGNAFSSNTKGGVGNMFCIYSAVAAGGTLNMTQNQNTVSNNTVSGGSVASGLFAITGQGTQYVCDGNTITNNTITAVNGAGIIGGMTGIQAGGVTTVLSATTNNTISGMILGGNSTGASLVRGILANSASTDNRTISGNNISNISTSFATSASCYGILTTTAGSNENIFNNKIYGFNPGQNGTVFSGAKGVSVFDGSARIYNNLIAFDFPIAVLTSANAVVGLEVAGGSTVNLYFNTIRLSGSGSGSAFGTSGISLASTSTTVSVQNNIVVNLMNGGGGSAGAASVGLRRTSAAMTGYASTSDRNIWYTGAAPGALNPLYFDGTTAYATLAAFKAQVATREANSYTENVLFQSTTPANANFLKVDMATPTVVESNARPVSPAVTTDYFATIRNVTTPDIGAHEDNFIPSGPTISNTSITPSAAQCAATAHTISFTVLGATSPVVEINWSLNGTPQTPIPMSNGGSGNVYTGVIPASGSAVVTFNATATESGNSASYAGTYQDNYLASNPITANATVTSGCVGTPTVLSSLGTPPAAPSSYCSTTYTSGTGSGDWISLVNILTTTLNNSSVGAVAPYYTQYPASGTTTATLTAGGAGYTMRVSGGTFGTCLIRGWIDYNHDGIFDAAESFGVSPNVGASTPANFAFVIPATAYNGPTRMRLRSSDTSPGPATSQACGITNSNFGETEDYTITITGGSTQALISGFASISWSDGVSVLGTTNPLSTTITLPGTNNYTITATDANGCTITASVPITGFALSAGPTANNGTQCGTGIPTVSVTATVAPGNPYKWYLNPTGGSPLAGESGSSLTSYVISVPTTFYVSQFDGACESARTAVFADVTFPDAVHAASTVVTNTCPFVNFTLSVTKDAGPTVYTTYTWSASPSAGSGVTSPTVGDVVDGHLVVQATTGGTFVYTVTATNGMCTTTSTVSVSVLAPPVVNASANPSTVCSGSPVTLTAVTNDFAPGVRTIGVQTATDGTNHPYRSGLGNSSRHQFLYSAAELLAAGLAPGNLTSIGFTVTTVGTGTLTNYSVGIRHTAAAAVTTTFDAGAFTTVLSGATVIAAAGLNTYTFTTPFTWNGTSNILVNICYDNTVIGGSSTVAANTPAFLGNVGLLGTVGACTGATGTTATLRPLTTFGGQVGSTGPGTLVWTWNPGNLSGNSVVVNPTSTTTYTVQGMNTTTGCSNFVSVPVTVNPLPATPTAVNSTQCGFGVPTAHVVSTGGIISWYLVPTGGTPIAGETGEFLTSYAIGSPTTFYVSESDANCTSARVAVFADVTNPDPISAAASTPTCLGSNIALTVTQTGSNNVYTYNWNASPLSGSGLSGSTAGDPVDGHLNVTPTAAATYSYTVTGTGGGCSTISVVTVTVTPNPSITVATASPNPACAGSTITLTGQTGTSATSLKTVGTGTLQNLTNSTVDMPHYGNYYTGNRHQVLILASELNALGVVGASSINSMALDVVSNTNALGYKNFTIAMKNTSTNALGLTFETGANQVYTIANFNPIPGWNTHVFNTPFAWNGTSNVLIETYFSDCPNCTGGNTCGTTGDQVSYTLNAVTNQSTTSFNSHAYYYSDGAGCNPNTVTTATTFNTSRPNMQLSVTTSTVGAGSYTWQWGPGGLPSGNVVTVTPLASTTYIVTATDPLSGCTSTQSVPVTIIPVPNAPTASNSVQCGVGVPTASVSGSGGSFVWYTVPTGGTAIAGEIGSSLTTYSINTTTTFYVSEYDGTCEGPRVMVIADVLTPDPITAAASSPTCLGSTITLSVSQTGSTNAYSFSWNGTPAGSGITGTVPGDVVDGHLVVTPTASGTYTYSVTGVEGSCTAVSSVSVTVTPVPVLDSVKATPSTVCAGGTISLSAYSGTIGNGPQTPPTGYCLPTYSTGCTFPDYISNVTFASINRNSTCDAPSAPLGYSSYNSPIPTVVAGNSYPVSVSTDGDVEGVAIWIDLNRNGVFETPSERVFSPTLITTVGATYTGTILIPSTATSGQTMMRVADNYNVAPSDPCPNITWGETEDYVINIQSIVPVNPNYTYTWNPGALSGQTVTTIPSGSTTYIVTATDPVSGCFATGSAAVVVNAIGPAPTATNSSQCGVGVPAASVAGTGGSFVWYTVPSGGTALAGEIGSMLTTYSINATTTFYVAEFDGSCESGRVMVIATVNQPDLLSVVAAPNPVCGNSPVTLTSSQTGSFNTYALTWSASPSVGSGLLGTETTSAITVTPTVGGTFIYTVHGSDVTNGCATFGTVSVSVTAPPPITSITASPSSVCPGGSTTLEVQSLTVGTGPQSLPSGYPASGSTIHADEQIFSVAFGSMLNAQAETCTSGYTDYDGIVAAPTITAGDVVPFEVRINECDNAPYYGPGVSIYIDYNRDGDFGDAGEQAYTSNGTLAATAASPGGDAVRSGNITIPMNVTAGLTKMRVIANEGVGSPTPDVTFNYGEAEDYSINIQGLISNPALTYSWNPGGGSGSSITVTPSATTTYSVVVSDPGTGCTSSASVTVTVITSIATPIAVANPMSLCGPGTVTLSTTNGNNSLSYQWQTSGSGTTNTWTNIGTGSGTTATISSDTYFRVYATCGVIGDTSNTVLVTVNNPGVTSSTPATRCGPGSVTVSVSGLGSFDWYANSTAGSPLPGGTNTSSFTSIVNSTTTFWVEAYIGTCTTATRTPVTATVNAGPPVTVTASPGTTICDNQTLTLTASSPNAGYTYGWSTNGGTTIIATGAVFTANPAVNTTYTLVATDNSGGPNAGCGNVVSTPIIVNPAPAVPVISPSAPSICAVGECVNLTISNAIGSNPGLVNIGLPSTGSIGGNEGNPYRSGNGTGNQIRSQLLVLASELTASGLTAGPITSLALTTTASSTGTMVNFEIKAGHTSATSLTTTFETTPMISVFTQASFTPVSAGLNTHTFSTPFMWNGTSNVIFNICQQNSALGTATVETSTPGFNGNTHLSASTTGCTDATGSSANAARPVMQIGGLVATTISYNWNPGSLSGSTVNVCPTSTTIYTAIGSYPTGCSSSATVTVTYAPVTTPVITANGPTTFCQGGSITLDAGAGYGSYSWSSGETTQSITVSPASTTTYTVTVSNGGTCSASASQMITIAPLTPPSITSTNGSAFCAGGSTTLDAGASYASYLWSTSATTQTISVNSTGTYTVTVSNGGCTASSSIVISVNPVPPTATITPTGPINICDNGSSGVTTLTADITGAGAGATIFWNDINGTSTNTLDVDNGSLDPLINGNTFDYSFTVTNSFGCSAISNAVTVNIVPCGGVTLNAKFYLEGYYAAGGSAPGLMNNLGGGGCLFVNSVPGAVATDCDTVRISMMDAVTYATVDTKTGILQTNGTISVTFGGSVVAGNSYYIKVKHRNAVETWSANPVLTSATTSYDFSTAANKAFGSNQVQTGDGLYYAFYSGDISDAALAQVGVQDGIIESQDYSDMENAVYVTLLGYETQDITGDGIVESLDYSIMENNVFFVIFSFHP